jgi:hypothetical protein
VDFTADYSLGRDVFAPVADELSNAAREATAEPCARADALDAG